MVEHDKQDGGWKKSNWLPFSKWTPIKKGQIKKCSDFNKILYLGVVFHDCQNCDNNFKSVAILKIWGQVAKFQIAVIYIKFDILW